ncbi:MAG: glycosyltransferase family 39 protein [Candidatus Omnitrophota bacterium]
MKEVERHKDWRQFVFIDKTDYPPFYYWTGAVLGLSFRTYNVLFFNSAFYLVVLLVSVYGIGRELMNIETGCFSAIICSFSPFIYNSSIQFNLELATAALVSLIVCMIVLSRGFSRGFYTFLMGVALVMGGYTRQMVFIFVAGPVLMGIIKLCCNKNLDMYLKLKRLACLGIVLGISFGCLLPYYHVVRWTHPMIQKINLTGWAQGGNVFSFEHLIYYIRVIPQQIGWVYTIVFGLSLVVFLKADVSKRQIIFSWSIPSLLIFSLFLLKFPELTIANIPAMALIIAYAVCLIKPLFLKNGVAVLILILSMCNYFRSFPW